MLIIRYKKQQNNTMILKVKKRKMLKKCIFSCNPISVATIIMFLGTTYISSNLKGLNRQDKISFSTMPGPNIPSLTILLEHFQIN